MATMMTMDATPQAIPAMVSRLRSLLRNRLEITWPNSSLRKVTGDLFDVEMKSLTRRRRDAEKFKEKEEQREKKRTEKQRGCAAFTSTHSILLFLSPNSSAPPRLRVKNRVKNCVYCRMTCWPSTSPRAISVFRAVADAGGDRYPPFAGGRGGVRNLHLGGTVLLVNDGAFRNGQHAPCALPA